MISVFSPYITRKDMDLVLSRMVEDAVVANIFCERFERAIKEQFQFEYAIAFRSPIYALIKALKICDLHSDSKIAISALAPAWHGIAVEEAGHTPIILDIEEESLHPSIDALKSANPSAIVLFDALGKIPPRNLIENINIPIIEDISQAVGCMDSSKSSAMFAHFMIWSMEADSAIATGGGGLLCTRGKRDAQILRTLNDTLLAELKMTDYNAALGISQLKSYSQMVERRRAICQTLSSQLSRTKHTGIQFDGEMVPTYAFPVYSQTSTRDIIEYAKKYGVQALAAFESSAAMLEQNAEMHYPTARAAALRCIVFPMHHKLTNQQVDQIGKIIATLP